MHAHQAGHAAQAAQQRLRIVSYNLLADQLVRIPPTRLYKAAQGACVDTRNLAMCRLRSMLASCTSVCRPSC